MDLQRRVLDRPEPVPTLAKSADARVAGDASKTPSANAIIAKIPTSERGGIPAADRSVVSAPETQARTFEPFFTTKDQGKATGLGGIVKQSGSHTLDSKESPTRARRSSSSSERLPPEFLRGNEIILLVEDVAQVRALAWTISRRSGYVVLEPANGGEAP